MPGSEAGLRRYTNLILLFLVLAAGCARREAEAEAEVLTLSGTTMGTVYQIRVVARAADLVPIRQEIARVLERVNRQMSVFDPQSELSVFNRERRTDVWVPVSTDTARVVADAQAISPLTGGAYDVTLGPLIRLWGFGPDGPRGEPPSRQEIISCLERVGWKRLQVRFHPPALLKQHPELELNLSSVAKGFGVDAVAISLERRGVVHYVVEIGGEIRARGHHPAGRPWRIGIARPVPGVERVYRVVTAGRLSMATSGDYQNFFTSGSRIYSHTLDPATGMPVAHPHASVTVLHERCAIADAWATALSVLPALQARETVQREQLAVLILERTAEGEITSWESPAFRVRLQESLAREGEGA